MKRIYFALAFCLCSLLPAYGSGGRDQSPSPRLAIIVPPSAQPPAPATQEPAPQEPDEGSLPDDEWADEWADDAWDYDPGPIENGRWVVSDVPTLSTGGRDSRPLFELGLLDISLTGAVSGMGILDAPKLLGTSGPINATGLDLLKADIGLFARPVYARFPIEDLFVLDVFTGLEAKVRANMTAETVNALYTVNSLVTVAVAAILNIYDGNYEKAVQDIYDYLADGVSNVDGEVTAGGSVFAELGFGGSKTLPGGRLWVRAAPSLFFTILSMKEGTARIKGLNKRPGTDYLLKGDGAVDMYTAWDFGGGGSVNPFASPGLDITLESRLAILPELDAGLSVFHIPLVPSLMRHKTVIDATKMDIPISLDGITDMIMTGEFPSLSLSGMFVHGMGAHEWVMRPVRFDAYALIKPFRAPLLVVRPSAGASVNTAFAPAMFNASLGVQFNTPGIFSASVGTALTEGVYTQSFGAAFDFGAFAFDLGLGLSGLTFADSWRVKGMSAAIGFKFGR